MKKMILALMLLSMNCNYPQELIKLFQKDLTDRIKFESYPKQMVSKDLDMASKIHPELLYYYITYHNLKYDGKVEQIYRLYDKELGEARSKYIKERNGWFSLGEEQLKVMEKDSSQLEREFLYLQRNNPYKSTKIGQLCDGCFKADKNRLDYIVYKYYMQDNDLMYLPNEDYSVLRKEYEQWVKKQVDESYIGLKKENLSKGKAEDSYTKLISYWYLFPETGENGSLQAQFTKYIVNNFYKDMKIKDAQAEKAEAEIVKTHYRKSMGLVLNFTNVFIKSFVYKFPSERINAENKFDIPTRQIYGGANYTIRLMDRDFICSKIILELGGGININENALKLYSPGDVSSGKKERLISINMRNSNSDNVDVKRIYNASFKARTPLLYLGDNFNLGAGLVVNYFSVNFINQYACTINEEMYHSYTTDWLNEYDVEGSSSLTKIYPILAAEYKLPFGITLGGEASIDYFSVGIGM